MIPSGTRTRSNVVQPSLQHGDAPIVIFRKINCPATVREIGGDWIPGARDHVHQPTPGACVAASIATIAKENAKKYPLNLYMKTFHRTWHVQHCHPLKESLPMATTIDETKTSSRFRHSRWTIPGLLSPQ